MIECIYNDNYVRCDDIIILNIFLLIFLYPFLTYIRDYLSN